jgi:hypothetical protein
VVINEFVAINVTGLTDEDGDYKEAGTGSGPSRLS